MFKFRMKSWHNWVFFASKQVKLISDFAAEELYLAASCPSSRGLHLFTPDVIFLVWM